MLSLELFKAFICLVDAPSAESLVQRPRYKNILEPRVESDARWSVVDLKYLIWALLVDVPQNYF